MTEDKLPKWLSIAIEKIPVIKNSTAEIINSGITDIQRGLSKVRYGESVHKDLDYLSSIVLNNKVEQYSGDEQVKFLGSMLGGTITNLADEALRMKNLCSNQWNNGEFDQQSLQSTRASTDMSSGSAVYFAHSIDERIRSLDKDYESNERIFPSNRLTDREEILSSLRSILLGLGGKFLSLLESSEESLLRKNPGDYIAAAHLMRECFDDVLNKLAPNKVVENQSWFLEEYVNVRGVPRIAKLMYIVRNSKIKFVDEDLQNIESEMNNAKCAMETCIEIAHGHMSGVDFETVKSTVDLVRYYLLTILELNSN